jgi:RNA-directed DNA polymerase
MTQINNPTTPPPVDPALKAEVTFCVQSVASPILANICLHELDLFMEELKTSFDRGKFRKINPEYAAIQRQLYRRRKLVDRLKSEQRTDELAINLREIRALEAQQKRTPSKDWFDQDYRRLRYCRYADDFLVGVIGSKKEAMEILNRIRLFLGEELALTVSEEKSGIMKANDGTFFLGYSIRTRKTDRMVRTRMRGRYVTKRAPSDYVQLRAPVEKLTRFVEAKGYGNYHTLRSVHRGLMIHSSDAEIVMAYNAELRGLASYYKLSGLWHRDLGRVCRIWWFSLMKTLAGKHRTTVRRSAQRLRDGDELVVRYTVDDKEKRCVVFRLRHLDRRPVRRPEIDNYPRADWITARSDILDRLNARVCEACGTTGTPMEVHHVRKLADMARAPLLRQVAAARRRKRVVLCRPCHVTLHAGTLPDKRHLDMQARRAG